MAANVPERMSPALRTAVLGIFGFLWLSGCLWLILHHFFARTSDFGPVPHPWAPAVLQVHGWVAVAGVFLLGWLTASHMSDRWPRAAKRTSGVAIATLGVLLALTGYGLYYTTERLHEGAAFLHEVLGVAGVFFALTHWRRFRVPRRSRLQPG